jgi:hypothetical protein
MPLDKKKLNKLLVNIVIKLVKKTIPVIMNMAYEAGIENLAKLKEEVKLPDFCLPIPILEKMLAIRNSLIDELNIVDKQIKTIVQPVDNLNPKLDDAQTVLDIANTAIPIGEIALGFFVSPPGAPGAAITSLFVAKTAVGIAEPIVMEIKNVINIYNNKRPHISCDNVTPVLAHIQQKHKPKFYSRLLTNKHILTKEKRSKKEKATQNSINFKS